MTGTISGAKKALKTIYEKHGKDYFKRIGSMGGSISCIKGFATNPELAIIAGKKGGSISKRGKVKNGKN